MNCKNTLIKHGKKRDKVYIKIYKNKYRNKKLFLRCCFILIAMRFDRSFKKYYFLFREISQFFFVKY